MPTIILGIAVILASIVNILQTWQINEFEYRIEQLESAGEP